MLKSFFSRSQKPVASQVAMTMRSHLRMHTQELPQVQYLTERYTATEVNKKLIVFRADTDERFTVDRIRKELKRIDLGPQQAQIAAAQQAMGAVSMVQDPEPVQVDGYTCRRVTFGNEAAAIALSGESLIARFPGLERTALSRERALDRRTQPFSIEMEPDEAVVRSTVKVLAPGMEQNQSSELQSLEEGIENLAELDEIMTWKVVD